VVRPAKAQEIEDMRLEFGQRLIALSQNSAPLRKNQRCGQDVGGMLVHRSELSFCLRGLYTLAFPKIQVIRELASDRQILTARPQLAHAPNRPSPIRAKLNPLSSPSNPILALALCAELREHNRDPARPSSAS
jgi:hypothetical protein